MTLGLDAYGRHQLPMTPDNLRGRHVVCSLEMVEPPFECGIGFKKHYNTTRLEKDDLVLVVESGRGPRQPKRLLFHSWIDLDDNYRPSLSRDSVQFLLGVSDVEYKSLIGLAITTIFRMRLTLGE